MNVKLTVWVAGAYALVLVAVFLLPVFIFILTEGQGIY